MRRALRSAACSASLPYAAIFRAADYVPKYSWIWRIAIDPSPTAEATRLTEPLRTSPAANTPGWLVSESQSASRHRCGTREDQPKCEKFSGVSGVVH